MLVSILFYLARNVLMGASDVKSFLRSVSHSIKTNVQGTSHPINPTSTIAIPVVGVNLGIFWVDTHTHIYIYAYIGNWNLTA